MNFTDTETGSARAIVWHSLHNPWFSRFVPRIIDTHRQTERQT